MDYYGLDYYWVRLELPHSTLKLYVTGNFQRILLLELSSSTPRLDRETARRVFQPIPLVELSSSTPRLDRGEKHSTRRRLEHLEDSYGEEEEEEEEEKQSKKKKKKKKERKRSGPGVTVILPGGGEAE